MQIQTENGISPEAVTHGTYTNTNYVDAEETSGSTAELHMFAIGVSSTKSSPIRCEVEIEGTPLTMEIDTGAEVSIISDDTRKSLFPQSKLSNTDMVLKTYTEQTVLVVGELNVTVRYGTQTKQLKLYSIRSWTESPRTKLAQSHETGLATNRQSSQREYA